MCDVSSCALIQSVSASGVLLQQCTAPVHAAQARLQFDITNAPTLQISPSGALWQANNPLIDKVCIHRSRCLECCLMFGL